MWVDIWNVMYIRKYIKCFHKILYVVFLESHRLVKRHLYLVAIIYIFCGVFTLPFFSHSWTCVIKIDIFLKNVLFEIMTLLWRWQDQKSNYSCTLSTWFSPLGKKNNILACPVSKSKLHNKDTRALPRQWVWVTDFLFNSFCCRGSSWQMPLLLTSYLATKYSFMKAWSVVQAQSTAIQCSSWKQSGNSVPTKMWLIDKQLFRGNNLEVSNSGSWW